MIAKRNFLLFMRKLQLDKPRFSLNALTQNRLDVLLRCISATFFLSNSFRRDTNLFIAARDESQLLELEGSLLKGLNPDERAIAGWLRKNLRTRNNCGLQAITSGMDEFLANFSTIFILDQAGTPIEEVGSLPPGALFAIGSHQGFSQEDKKRLQAHGGQLISLGMPEYLSSTTISIIQWTLDRYFLESKAIQ
jgi:tRNA (pseudouridine54-N1)-methyltransferase